VLTVADPTQKRKGKKKEINVNPRRGAGACTITTLLYSNGEREEKKKRGRERELPCAAHRLPGGGREKAKTTRRRKENIDPDRNPHSGDAWPQQRKKKKTEEGSFIRRGDRSQRKKGVPNKEGLTANSTWVPTSTLLQEKKRKRSRKNANSLLPPSPERRERGEREACGEVSVDAGRVFPSIIQDHSERKKKVKVRELPLQPHHPAKGKKKKEKSILLQKRDKCR